MKTNHQKVRWTEAKKPRPSMEKSWINNSEKTSILMHSMSETIRKFWTRLSILRNVGRTSGAHWHCQYTGLNCPHQTYYISTAPSTAPDRDHGNSRDVENRPNSLPERHRSCTVKMGITDRICSEKGCLLTLLCRGQKGEGRYLKDADPVRHQTYNLSPVTDTAPDGDHGNLTSQK